MKFLSPFFFLILAVDPQSASASPTDSGHTHGGGHEHDGGDHHGPLQAQISHEMAERAGITTAVAEPDTLHKTLTVYGEVSPSPDSVSHVRARFPGAITEVHADIGDMVQAGALLARVESNESLQLYAIKAPIAGMVTARHANTGETTAQQVLFTITNTQRLWAALKIFPTQRSYVAEGQPVTISSGNLHQRSTLKHIVPHTDGHPFVTARAELPNTDSRWTPGLLVNAAIEVGTIEADVVVDSRALHTLNGRAVVFIDSEEGFTARPVEVGQTDGEKTEILSGLTAGEPYVVDNSYLIKADIKKSEASHSH